MLLLPKKGSAQTRARVMKATRDNLALHTMQEKLKLRDQKIVARGVKIRVGGGSLRSDKRMSTATAG